ncbi:hypothetical protein Nepgr_011173 [Nepenthes gracilis]|uniref:Uncharacterized protein n=1 Tax=Nepenthes gracilis TaxID=150966 RepID=A0AAD3SEQ5_NEPGR|nr:hypothetical protein Nepgr_011173 [Nepenthes gracilis]
MAGTQILKRIPRIKFPQRHPKPSGSSLQPLASATDDAFKTFVSQSPAGSSTLFACGKASLQPKRAPVSNEEIEAILLGGCI